MTPALAWLRATGGDPTKLAFWTPRINTWVFGVGALLGTIGSGIIFNLKGMVLLELPGPRLLLMMKANLLSAMPERKGTAEGTFLAVMDLDYGRGMLTIGLVAEFSVNPLLRIEIPTEAFFHFDDTSNWHLYLGQYINQVQATVFHVFDASGYLMLSGSGIAGIPGLPVVTGFSIATGLHVSFTWGGGPLYARLAAGFDAVVGFSPFRMAGNLDVRGTLHLFILDISAWARLQVDVGEIAPNQKVARITGELCGRVEFLFFSIEGCVNFSLGEAAPPIPDPPDLVSSVKLISRSPALVMGSGTDQPIDGSIGTAVASSAQPATMPTVPIDAIPVVLMSMPPLQDVAATFRGQPIGGSAEAPADGWTQRGDVSFKYTLKSVELIGPLTAGKTPATWWKPRTAQAALEAQLALLSWVPEATPKAVGSSKYLYEAVRQQWGTVCAPVAPAAAVLFTFMDELLGPSRTGWLLKGSAWPDPADTVRSSPPDVRMRVTERWRTGDVMLDTMRGIVPAEVEGLAVVCPNAPPIAAVPGTNLTPGMMPMAPPATLTVNPLTVLRGAASSEVITNEPLTLPDVIQRFSSGQPVGRATMLGSLRLPAAPLPGAGECFARALASPLGDEGYLAAYGGPTREDLVRQRMTELNYRPGPLDDAVVFETGEFDYARFYLWVPLQFLDKHPGTTVDPFVLNTGEFHIVVAAANASDTLLRWHVVTLADRMPPRAFPPAWRDTSGPWHGNVTLLGRMLGLQREYVGVMVEIKGGGGADRIQVGARPIRRELRRVVTLRPYYVAAVEVMRRSEAVRSAYDTTEQRRKQEVLQNALGLDSADNALLAAGQTYQVRVTWDAERERRPDGRTSTDKLKVPGKQQTFWFRTDTSPPARIDPWVLVALPGEGEQHWFAAEPVKIVFATNNLAQIFDAYGKKLQARLRPASFRPVPPTATVPHPFPLRGAALQPVAAAVLSPWEQAVQTLVTGSCVPVRADRTRHTRVTIPIPLDLETDYVLDIEMLNKTAPVGAAGQRVWRRWFSTGGFRTLSEFANSFQLVRVSHRGVHATDAGKLRAIGNTFAARPPEGPQVEAAMTQAGLDPQPVPASPRAVIFWEPGAAGPQPVAVLLDASEPMWRARPVPKQVTDPGSAAGRRYEMVSTPWLEVIEQPGGDTVDRIIPAPGGQRALVTLKPGARGRRLSLALRRIPQREPYLDGPAAPNQFFTVLDTQLLNAPWEEVD
jgi:hypothetical protein